MSINTAAAQVPPRMSARTIFDRRSVARLAVLFIALGAVVVAAPAVTLVALTGIITVWYLASTIDRNWLLIKGIRSSALLTVTDEDALAVPDDELPSYTVLLPVYGEPTIVQELINGVGKINYPADKIDVLLLLEEDDLDTRAAAEHALPPSVRVVVVPHSMPKTKPKACNYGMSLPDLRGEMMTIYDAEDIPDPLQLRKVVVALRRAAPGVGCVQCRLGYFNETQNLLTRWFAMEYDRWFGVVLPTVERARCVVLLGGTSNHIPVRVWRDVGGWDEFNVTEDADLGVRLARLGYRTVMLDSITLEEANSDLVNWIRQRSRWYKGYLQTMMVHLRNPLQLRREIGTKAILRLVNMTGGVPLGSVMNLFFWFVMLSWIAGRPHFVATVFPASVYYLSLLLLVIVTPLSMFIKLLVLYVRNKPYLWWATLLTPLYWLLQSVAAIKAIYQLAFRPQYWEKTVHGLAEIDPLTAQHRPSPSPSSIMQDSA